MAKVSRRDLMAGTGALCAAIAAPSAGNAQLVYRHSDWKAEEFQELIRKPVHVRQLFDIININEGKFLNNIKNSLNGLEFGYGISPKQVQIVAALHGAVNALNFDDSMWAKYKLGEWLAVNDPETGKPAVRNIFAKSKIAKVEGKEDPSGEHTSYQDKSIEGLQRRGVKFLSCHTATEEQSRVIVSRLKLTDDVETVVNDLQSHVLPGVLIVPSMVATVALLQIDGHYSYITV
jgi:hypothetical protein